MSRGFFFGINVLDFENFSSPQLLHFSAHAYSTTIFNAIALRGPGDARQGSSAAGIGE